MTSLSWGGGLALVSFLRAATTYLRKQLKERWGGEKGEGGKKRGKEGGREG